MDSPDFGRSRLTRHCMQVVWPAFLGACLLEALVFSMVDPRETHWVANTWLLSQQSLYSVEFFSFWITTMLCGSLVLWLERPSTAVPDHSDR